MLVGCFLLTIGGLIWFFYWIFDRQQALILQLLDRLQSPPELSALTASRRFARAAQERHPSVQPKPESEEKQGEAPKRRHTLFGIPTSEIDPDDYMGDSS